MTPAERREFVKDNHTVLAKRRRKMTKAEQIKARRRALKNRKRRKYRSKFRKSKTGMKASIRIKKPDGSVQVKRIRKKFYFNTYDTNGNSLGTFWFVSPRPSKRLLEEYKAKHGVKHPAALPMLDERKLAAMKKKRDKK